jgi:DNA-binding LacI/PurR family transcriptional regulator
VSASAQRAVDEAVRTLRYVPNRAARTLVTRRTESVAIVVPEPDDRVFSDPFFAGTLRGVNDVLAEREIQLVLLMARPGAEENRLLRYLSHGHVDGAVVVSHHRDDGLASALSAIGMPCVFGGRPWDESAGVPYVDVDNIAGGRQATRHLIKTGRRRIGTVAGPSDMTAGVDRLAGWRQAMDEAGLATDAVAHGDFTEASGRAAAEQLFAEFPDLDGLFVASDLMARGSLLVAAEHGRRVPEDLSVVGYDDLGVASATTPALTTIRQPVHEMAERATRMLLEQIDLGGPGEAVRLIIPPRLVRRQSS